MRRFWILVAIVAGLVPLFVSTSATAGVFSELRTRFLEFETNPNQTQYAVAYINSTSTAFLWPPQPTPTTVTSTDLPRNWIYSYGAVGSDNHAEATIALNLVRMIQAYPATFGDAVQNVYVYTHYSPCSQCPNRLVSAMPLPLDPSLPPPVRLHVAFTEQFGTDANALAAIYSLQDRGVRLYRVCDPGVDCRTFQRALHSCALNRPIICKDCIDRGGRIAVFINKTMGEVRTRQASAWQPAIAAEYRRSPDQAEAVPAWTQCHAQAQGFPVGWRVGLVDTPDPDGGAMPTNWNRLNPPSPECGPAAFDPKSGKFAGCSPKAARRPSG